MREMSKSSRKTDIWLTGRVCEQYTAIAVYSRLRGGQLIKSFIANAVVNPRTRWLGVRQGRDRDVGLANAKGQVNGLRERGLGPANAESRPRKSPRTRLRPANAEKELDDRKQQQNKQQFRNSDGHLDIQTRSVFDKLYMQPYIFRRSGLNGTIRFPIGCSDHIALG